MSPEASVQGKMKSVKLTKVYEKDFELVWTGLNLLLMIYVRILELDLRGLLKVK